MSAAESSRLAEIRRQLTAIAPGQWSRVHDEDGCFVEARGEMGELVPVLRFHPGASDDEILIVTELPQTISFLLGLVDRAIAATRRQADPASAARQERAPARGKDFAAECAMKCAEPVFRVYLLERHGLARPLTDDRVAQRVRSILGITSRRALNDDADAAARWKALRGDFDAWRRAGR